MKGMVKLFASEIGVQITLGGVRVHRGYAYAAGIEVRQHFRPVRPVAVGDGTYAAQRNSVVS